MMSKAFVLACVFAAGVASPVFAANADHPYANCDRKVDSCGPTGNDSTDRLNSQQLGQSGAAAPMQDPLAPVAQPIPDLPMQGQAMPTRR